ncbi:putative phosphomannose isomerase type I [Leptospira ryugenii]|uniref:Putative phosphomannose isomerase type I n=1 Tax=Leptospira ryugenii TaxID=1917863 RepID=A0A2P2E2D0_9LEPT|nr:type I phosphomannose isomerase catalytic subunit [Leptospira ryugenii]GBF51009.1 putative phosphomannose isomerase type I [Leptospira ryugenii]
MSSFPSLLRFIPIYKEKIWGGRRLQASLKRNIPAGKIGESWELSDYGDDQSRISNADSISFNALYKQFPKEVLGATFIDKPFPLLVKIIDANDKLSVQVHPDDAYAETYDPSSSGKKECWMVLSAEPGAELVVGFSRTLERNEYESLVLQNNGEEPLRRWKVKAGDVFLLEPGTIHAIGAGVLLLEVQQSSDSTYRVYDYGRLGDDGKPRSLHLKKALDVLNFSQSDSSEKQIAKLISFSPWKRSVFTSNDKFRLESWEFPQAQFLCLRPLSNPVSFGIVYVKSGALIKVDTGERFQAGDTFLITAKAFENEEILLTEPKTELAFMGSGTDFVNWD